MSYTDVFGSETIPPAVQGLSQYTLTAAAEFSWPEDPSTAYTVAGVVELSAATPQTITLPDATKTSVGRDLLFRNIGAAAITVVDNASGAVGTLDSGKSYFFYLEDNNTAAGTWKFFTYGATTSTADAASLAGAGLSVDGVTLQQNIQTRSLIGAYTVVAADRARLILSGGGSYTLSLTSAVTLGEGFFFYLHNSGSGTVTVDPDGAQTIDGGATKGIAPLSSIIIFTDGANWYTVGYGRDVIFSFSEYAIVETTGSVTLTSSSVSGRMIRLSNPLTGNLTVNLPATAGIYYIKGNSWAGGYTATFQVTGGLGASVQLLTAQETTLYCDGTDITVAITNTAVGAINLVDGSSAAPALNFIADANTGFYRDGSDRLGLAAGGTGTAIVSSIGIEVATAPTLGAHLVNKTYVDAADALKSNIASPTFTGDPKAPTPAPGDNDTSIATTAFVQGELIAKANLASPTFTGDPKAPTPAPGDNDTSIATTAFVQGELVAKADVAGETYSGTHNFTGAIVTVATPVAPTQAATKAYADALSVAAGNVPVGGTTSQILTKLSNTDYDMDWSDAPAVPAGAVVYTALNFGAL